MVIFAIPTSETGTANMNQLTPLRSRNPSQDSQLGIPLLHFGQPLRSLELMLGQSLATILSLLTFHQLTAAPPSHPASGSEDRKPWQGSFTDLHSLGQTTVPTSPLLFPLKKNIKPTFHIHPLNNSLGSSYQAAKRTPCPRQRPRVHYRTLYEVSSRRDSTSQHTIPKGT